MIAMRTTVSVLFALLVSLSLASTASAAELPDFRDIVKEGSPAVVKILVEHSSAHGGQSPFDSDEIPE